MSVKKQILSKWESEQIASLTQVEYN